MTGFTFLKKTKYMVVYARIYTHCCVRDLSEFLCSALVPPPERSSDTCKFMWLREFSVLFWTRFSPACSPLYLSYFTSTFCLGALISELCLCQSAGTAVFTVAPWPEWVLPIYSQGDPLSSAEVAPSPGADGGWNIWSPFSEMHLLLTGVWGAHK